MRPMPFATREERAAHVSKTLESMYPKTPIPLDHRDAFTLLVAVVLSAQCTDKRVNLVTPELFALADTPKKMARVPVAGIQRIIRPCGLSPQKAKAISGLSRIIEEEHGGAVPRSFEELERLPGVGHKTASVVMSQAFGVPAFPVDTHIHRLAVPLAPLQGPQCRGDGARPEGPVPGVPVEPAAPEDDLFRPRALHREGMRRPRVRDLLLLQPEAGVLLTFLLFGL